jgi:hypothetical protein
MVVHAYYPLGEIRVQREAKALIDAGFEVDVVCLRRPDEPARDTEYQRSGSQFTGFSGIFSHDP